LYSTMAEGGRWPPTMRFTARQRGGGGVQGVGGWVHQAPADSATTNAGRFWHTSDDPAGTGGLTHAQPPPAA
jgi:hypothetical protein